jgi:hypothetical protein
MVLIHLENNYRGINHTSIIIYVYYYIIILDIIFSLVNKVRVRVRVALS